MNIFFLDVGPEACARYHCDRHVLKMLVEYAQLMCTTLHSLGRPAPYKPTHVNHPCAVWVRASGVHYQWLWWLTEELHREYQYRYGSDSKHRSWEVICRLEWPYDLPQAGFTPPPQVMPLEFRDEDPVIAYRNYYAKGKSHLMQFKRRGVPAWLEEYS